MHRKYNYLIIIALSSILLLTGCGGGKSMMIDRWSRVQIEKASPEIMRLLHEAGDRNTWPNAHTVTVYESDSSYFHPDGNQVAASYSLTKLLTMKATKDYTTIPIGYDTQQMTIDIIYVRVIYPDSTVVTVRDEDITDETLEGYAEMDIYWSNLRQKVIHLPELEVGCGLEFAIRIETVQPMLEGMMDYRAVFQSTEPVMHSEAILVVPFGEKIEWKVFNDPEGRVSFHERTVGDSLRVFHWEGGNFPMAITEDGMPSLGQFLTKVLASNISWRDYSKLVYKLSEPNMVADDAIRQTVAELTKDKTSGLDSIRAIFYYTAQTVRYIGLSMGDKEGITPHDVRKTFEAQAGVCKDKSALLAVMLEEAGFESYVALSNPMDHVHKEIAANQFNHMIVVAYDRDGKEYWMDPTDALCMDMLPAYHMTKASLICNTEGDDLMYHPVLPPQTQAGSISANSEILPDGTFRSVVEIDAIGFYDQVLRIIFQQMEPTQQERFWTQMVKTAVHPSAKVKKLAVTPNPIDNLWEPVKMTLEYEIPDYAIVAGEYLLVKSPMSTYVFDIIGLLLSQTTTLNEREFPLNIQFTIGSRLRETIKLPGGYSAKSLPSRIDIDEEPASFKMNYALDGNTVTYESSFMIKMPVIPADKYPDYRRAVKRMENSGQGMIILSKGGDA